MLGGDGSKAKRAAYQFIYQGLAHVIASGVNRETISGTG